MAAAANDSDTAGVVRRHVYSIDIEKDKYFATTQDNFKIMEMMGKLSGYTFKEHEKFAMCAKKIEGQESTYQHTVASRKMMRRIKQKYRCTPLGDFDKCPDVNGVHTDYMTVYEVIKPDA